MTGRNLSRTSMIQLKFLMFSDFEKKFQDKKKSYSKRFVFEKRRESKTG